jgi:hypothetical protein
MTVLNRRRRALADLADIVNLAVDGIFALTITALTATNSGRWPPATTPAFPPGSPVALGPRAARGRGDRGDEVGGGSGVVEVGATECRGAR